MFTFTGALAAMSIDLFDCSGHAAAGTRHQCDAPGRAAAAVMSIDRFKCSHVFNAYGDIRDIFFGAIGASPFDLSKRSKLFNVSGGII